MKKLTALLLVIVTLSMICIPVSALDTEQSEDTVILYTNDIHAYIDDSLSYDIIAALKKELQTRYAHVLLVDAGDHIQGSAYGAMDNGQTMTDLMNRSGYDLATLGNHEFDYGMATCLDTVDRAEFPYVSCNFHHVEDGVAGENVLESYRIFSCGDRDIAIVGITTPDSLTKAVPAYFQNENGEYIYGIYGGTDGQQLYDSVQNAIDEAEAAGADTVIALGHLGMDPSSQPWTSRETIAQVEGLSAFIDGHSHHQLEGEAVTDKAGSTVVLTQTGSYFHTIGMMVVDEDTGDITTKLLTAEDLAEIVPDAAVADAKNAWIDQVNEQLGETVGTAKITLSSCRTDSGEWRIRDQETNTGDFCTDSLYYLFDNMDMDVDVSLLNSGSIRSTEISGDITYMTCKNVFPFGNVACLMIVSGQQLLDALEWGARMIGSDSSSGAFLQVSGLTYDIDTTVPSTVRMDSNNAWLAGPADDAYRVHNVTIFNKDTNTYEPLDLSASYHLAGSSYTLRNFGDGYTMFGDAVTVLDYVMQDYMYLANYVKGFDNAEVDARNSPLLEKYPGLLLDYSDPDGSGRIQLRTRDEVQDEEDKPDQDVVIRPVIPTEPASKVWYFSDLDPAAWYYDDVQWALNEGLFRGVSDSHFAPEGTMTRAMAVTVLWRLAGAPDVGTTNAFADVADGVWYADAVDWATAAGIITGMDADCFAPDQNVTREQLAAILYRYALHSDSETPAAGGALTGFADAAQVSTYAAPAMRWAVETRLLRGSDGLLMPAGQATRAQMAALLARFVQS